VWFLGLLVSHTENGLAGDKLTVSHSGRLSAGQVENLRALAGAGDGADFCAEVRIQSRCSSGEPSPPMFVPLTHVTESLHR
jgi:hypothetical protein